jgi:hypothetical protein
VIKEPFAEVDAGEVVILQLILNLKTFTAAILKKSKM